MFVTLGVHIPSEPTYPGEPLTTQTFAVLVATVLLGNVLDTWLTIELNVHNPSLPT